MVYGALLAGVVIVVLLALRRITLKTFIPFGPFLIIGALWAILVLRSRLFRIDTAVTESHPFQSTGD